MTSYPSETPVQPQVQYVEKKTNGLAIAGLVCSLLQPILGLVFSLIALSQIKNDESQGGRNLAVAGLVISIVFLVLTIILVVLIAAFYAALFEALLDGRLGTFF